MLLKELLKKKEELINQAKSEAKVISKMNFKFGNKEYDRKKYPHLALFLDTETTSSDKNIAKLISYAGILVPFTEDMKLGDAIDSFYFLQDPKEPLDDVIKRVTGFEDKDLKGQEITEENQQTISDFYRKCDFIVAHNADYDYIVLKNNNLLFYDFENEYDNWLDTWSDIKWDEKHHITSAKLDYLCYSHDFYYLAHNALEDTKALITLCKQKEYFAELIENKISYKVLEVKKTQFQEKDKIKTRGYWWNGDKKCWYKKLHIDDIEEEMSFLQNTLSSVEFDVV